MSANENAVSFVVVRSPKYAFTVYEKETSTYRSAIESGGTIVKEGTEGECRSYRTSGQRFKDLYGYSKTMKKNMRKHGLNPQVFSDSVNEYRDIRKKRKKEQAKETKAKHDRARAGKKEKKAKVTQAKTKPVK